MLLFRLSGVLLLRFDVRRFIGLLFQDPPREHEPLLLGELRRCRQQPFEEVVGLHESRRLPMHQAREKTRSERRAVRSRCV